MPSRCMYCGTMNPDGTKFCQYCGTPMGSSAGPIDPPTEKRTAPQPKVIKEPAASVQSNYAVSAKEPTGAGSTNYVSSTGASGFIDKDEQAVYSLKNGYGLNMLSGEGWKSEDAVITTKRVYYYGSQGFINKVKQEEIVDLKDVTGSKITRFEPWAILLLGILTAVVGLIIGLMGLEVVFYTMLGYGVFFALLFMFVRKSYLKIEYAGGAIRFSVKKYGIENVRQFQRCIYAMKKNNSSI